jgi:hypothetical protein
MVPVFPSSERVLRTGFPEFSFSACMDKWAAEQNLMETQQKERPEKEDDVLIGRIASNEKTHCFCRLLPRIDP